MTVWNREKMGRTNFVALGFAAAVLCCFALSGAVAGADTAGIQLAQTGKKAGGDNWKRSEERVVSWGYEPTKVTVRGNSVLVPVTLVSGNHEADMELLLDTGSSATVISSEAAGRLHLDLARARKTRVQVVGGGILEARVARVSRLTVGPHTKREANVLIVPQKGGIGGSDGLLGMDVLKGLKYRVDFDKNVIVWE